MGCNPVAFGLSQFESDLTHQVMKLDSFDKYWELLEENDAKRSYACLMLDCSDFKSELKRIQKEIPWEDVYDDEPGHRYENDPHITVLYGIHEQDSDVVKEQLGDITPCKYKLTGISLFENDKFDVVKCTVESSDLTKLNKHCTDTLEFTNDYPKYVPHLTIAYVKPGTGKKYTKIKSDEFGKEKESNKFTFSDKDSNKTKWVL